MWKQAQPKTSNIICADTTKIKQQVKWQPITTIINHQHIISPQHYTKQCQMDVTSLLRLRQYQFIFQCSNDSPSQFSD